MAPIVSFSPEDFSTGGLSNLDAVIREPVFRLKEFEFQDDNGETQERTVVVLALNYEDADGAPHNWSYQVGSAEYVKIVDEEDGEALEEGPMIQGVGDRPYKINPTSEAGLFFTALKDAGFDLSALKAGDVTALEDLSVHVEGKEFKIERGKAKGKIKNVPLPVQLLEDEKPAKKAKAAASKAKAKAKAAEPDEDEGDEGEVDAEELAVETAVKILSKPKKFISEYDGDGEVEHNDLTTAAFLALKGNPSKNDVVKLLKDAKWIAGREEFTFDKKAKTVTLAD